MVGYEQRVSFLIKFMVIVSTVNLSKFFMLRTKLCQSQPLRQRSRDPEKEEQALLFMVQWGEMEDAGMELFGRIEWRMDAFDIDTALLSVSCLSLTPPPTDPQSASIVCGCLA